MLHTAVEEFDNINSWALKNNLKIHPSKTKEIIVFGRRSTRNQPPVELIMPGAERVEQLRVLGVLLNPQLSMGDHIDRGVSSLCVIEICSAYAKGARPSSSRVASCGKGDNCCLPAICLPGVVGVCHRGAAE